ncbi:MAG: prepilin-type cleavage/methylation domain-containing protein [Gomphosphaeria aponina SAG 52.96 = DSM 107014]|uniref:Prepilin-type cleavage/methylation domain-containing protein n=1 Tax=Gomphosphaeria aponina SAG 52.96 = DSM 107014 TaxID=1521640 RepID=A0A941GQ94_9CHRO|nr:prepilin-type cleavage/methylation domain-containing protein [Gomphosphaeria aponina SAG 52.96 = DSM 107014]
MIELLVVILMVSLLAVISYPNYINQIGKARETDAKNYLGAIARAQQAYHWEAHIFAADLNKLQLYINATGSTYYDFPVATIATTDLVKHNAVAIDPIKYQVKNYAIGVYFNAGLYDIAICQGFDIGEDVNVADTNSGNCDNNGIKIK